MAGILAMILAGGRVDDLGVLTLSRPKSVMPFGGLYRVIDFPMSNLMHSGIEKVGILSQYRPLDLMNHIGNGESWDMVGRNRSVTILPPFQGFGSSDWYKGTADAVYQNLSFIRFNKPDLILILSGDHVYKMDYRELIGFHLENKADMTAAFVKVPLKGAHRFGLALIGDEDVRGGRVLKYVEKPRKPLFNWASLTIYVFSPYALFESLEANAGKDSHEFGRDIIPSLLSENYKVYGYKHYGYWGYARTPEEYWNTSMDLLGKSPKIDLRSWRIRTNILSRDVRDRQAAVIGPSAATEDVLFYTGCRIKGKVSRSILFPGVIVDEGAIVEDSVLFHDTVIKARARVARTIADVGVTVGTLAEIGEAGARDLTIVGRDTRIAKEVKIGPGVVVYPNMGPAQFTRLEYGRGEVVK